MGLRHAVWKCRWWEHHQDVLMHSHAQRVGAQGKEHGGGGAGGEGGMVGSDGRKEWSGRSEVEDGLRVR